MRCMGCVWRVCSLGRLKEVRRQLPEVQSGRLPEFGPETGAHCPDVDENWCFRRGFLPRSRPKYQCFGVAHKSALGLARLDAAEWTAFQRRHCWEMFAFGLPIAALVRVSPFAVVAVAQVLHGASAALLADLLAKELGASADARRTPGPESSRRTGPQVHR